MALNKTDLNLVLNAEGRKKEVGNARFQDQSISAIEETFVKTTTTLGQEDGKILGGIKSLGQSTNSSEEVITSAVGLITDTLPALSGAKGNVLTVTNATVLDSDGKFLRYKLPSDSDGSLVLNALSIDSAGGVVSVVRSLLGRDSDDNARSFGSTTTSVTALTGLPALKANVPTSALAVVTDGTGQSIAECVSIAEQKKNADFAEITAFTDVIEAMRPPASAGGGLFGKIKSAMSAVSFAGGLGATLNQLAPVAALNDTLAQVTSKVNELETLALGATEKFAALGTEAMAIGDGMIQSTLDQVTNITGVQDLIAKGNNLKDQLNTLPTINDVIGTDLSNVVDVVNKVTDEVNQFESDFDLRIDEGLLGTLQNVAEGLTGDAASYISNLVSGGIVSSDQERQQILAQFSSDDPRQKKEAVKTLTGKSINVSERMKSIIGTDENTSTTLEMQVQMIKKAREQGVPEQEIAIAQQEISTIDDKMSKLDTTIGGSVVVEASLFEEAVSIDQSSKWSGRNSPDDIFTYISSVEELDAEFTNVHREVTEVIVHASETHTNKNIGAIEINNIHTELGHDGIGYHYVIRRDGRLQRGRPVNTEGEHAIVNGHDKRSIGLVMVGGLNVSTGEDNPTNYRSAQSFTREQFTTLEKFFASYYRRFPGGQVFGHNDVDEAEHDPYFDVVDYVDSVFRKKNKLIDPKTNGPMSPSEINSDN